MAWHSLIAHLVYAGSCINSCLSCGLCMYVCMHVTLQLDQEAHSSGCLVCRLHPHHHGSSSVQTHTATVPVLLGVNPSGGLDPLSSESCTAADMKRFFPVDNSNEIILHIQVVSQSPLLPNLEPIGSLSSMHALVYVMALVTHVGVCGDDDNS